MTLDTYSDYVQEVRQRDKEKEIKEYLNSTMAD